MGEAMGTTWRGDYTLGQDPLEMLQSVRVFALGFKHPLIRSSGRNSLGALRLAYATIDLPSQQTDNALHTVHDQEPLVVPERMPQIYFLTSGQPDGGASQVLDNIDVFDNNRNIHVNSIAFVSPAYPAAKQFAKDLANKTGGFFRSLEQASLYANK